MEAQRGQHQLAVGVQKEAHLDVPAAQLGGKMARENLALFQVDSVASRIIQKFIRQ